MNNFLRQSNDYNRVEKALRFLGENRERQPSLQETARKLGLSEYHFQRIFTRWAGISPKQFLQFLTKEYARDLLKKSSLLEASYEAGLSGPGRLHDLFVKFEAMTPGEYKLKGQGLVIEYGFHPTHFGECFIAVTSRGICALAFIEPSTKKESLSNFKKNWSNATVRPNQAVTKKWIHRIFSSQESKLKNAIPLFCRGTNFQVKVWEALLKIPAGSVVPYQTIAKTIGAPRAARAVGTAIGQNPVAYIIPCHRVIRSVGELGGYRWGLARKKAMLAIEAKDACHRRDLKDNKSV